MELTKKQEEGLKIAVSRYTSHEPYTCIAGYAGTGKSTLVSFIIDALDVDKELVAYIAYTGKASLVLKEKGCPNAMTAHKLLYKAFRKPDGEFVYQQRRPLDKRYELIVVDEVSMLPQEMWDLLLSHHVYVLALGDPGQLPPVNGSNDVLAHPHVFLDEVVRQAQESEIIRLSMDIRAGKPLNLFDGSDVKIVNQRDMVDGMYTWADAILCGKNNTRYQINDLMRSYIWDRQDPTPIIGDKVICGHNDWKTLSNIEEQPLVNGLIGTVNSLEEVELEVPHVGNVKIFNCGLDLEDGIDGYDPLFMDAKLFLEHTPIVTKENYRWLKNIPIKPFEYAYAITCHKAQGSEYDKVLVLEESWPGQEHIRWLYTACTRAAKKLVIVRNFSLCS
jgi:exodeoxyribonuclease-5